ARARRPDAGGRARPVVGRGGTAARAGRAAPAARPRARRDRPAAHRPARHRLELRRGRTEMTALFYRCGGFAAVRKVVSAFYDKVLEAPALRGYFVGVDVRRLIDHQTKFIAMVMGGPASFPDEALRRAHAGLGVSRADFAEMALLLREALEDAEFDPADVEWVHGEILRREPLIVAGAQT